ncbi:hypothetical protein FLAG1_00824 [Fusarium langsethiae]|uniref:Uncharacterized protein n=1 Tax=Fusarium langsethiae TaxID=179993 RepID=A0A0M9F5H1_FUSLA|nr:hypothetical protein FLAG1_00824 [Fusarium langsethiae]
MEERMKPTIKKRMSLHIKEMVMKKGMKPGIKEGMNPIMKKRTNPIIKERMNPTIKKRTNPNVKKRTGQITKERTKPNIKERMNPIIKKRTNPISRGTNLFTKKRMNPNIKECMNRITKKGTNPNISKMTILQSRKATRALSVFGEKNCSAGVVLPTYCHFYNPTHSNPYTSLDNMEGYDDARCLPRIPKLFPTSDSQPDLVLYSASSDDGSSANSYTPHALDTCNEMFTAQIIQASQDNTASTHFCTSSTHSDDDCREETTEDWRNLGNEALKPDDYSDGTNSGSSGGTTPNAHLLATGTALIQAQEQAPQPLTRHRLQSIPDTRLYKLGSVYNKLKVMAEDSQVATAGSDTSRPGPDADPDGTLEDPDTASEPEYPAYYIFDPRSAGSAYYMYQDADTQEGYKIEKVPFKPIFPEPGQRAYYIEASEKDQGEPRHASQDTLWRVDSSRIPAVVIDSDSSDSHEAVVDTNKPLYAEDEATQSIARKVSDRLQKIRHLREHLRVINGKGRDVPEARGLYLIGDKDIRDVVSIVLSEVLKNGHIDRSERRTTTTESSEGRPLPKLDGDSNTILVPTPTAVDPATTINLPNTSYANINASDMQVHTKTRGAESDTTTTVITRRSVAEIVWARASPEGYDPDSRTHGRTVSDCCSPTHGGSRSCPDDRRQSHPKATSGDPILRHYATPKSTAEILADIMCNKSFEKQLRVSDGTVITSFPRLFSRDLTSDWSRSFVDNGDLNKPAPSTLYHHGVDARNGLHEPVSSPSNENPPMCPTSPTNGSSLFDANPFNPKTENKYLSTPLAAVRRLSASLDADTQRRRSTLIADIEEETLDDCQPRPGLMNKIKHGGHKLFHKSHFRRPNGSTTTEDDAFEESSVVHSGNSTGRGGTPEPPISDISRVHKTATGSKLNVASYEEGICSEDDEPHRCVNDSSSRDTSPK